MQISQGLFKYFRVYAHVQTERKSPDLNMNFRLFDNGLISYTNRYLCKNLIFIVIQNNMVY